MVVVVVVVVVVMVVVGGGALTPSPYSTYEPLLPYHALLLAC